MKRLACLTVCSLLFLSACSYLPKRRKRSKEERTQENIKQFKSDTNRIKGKDAPGKLF